MVDFTVMIRVLVIIPYKELEEGFLKAIDACECDGVEFTLAHFYGTNPGDIDPASKYDIVVARGMTYYAMRMRYPSLHIIALDTSANGLMEALDRVLSEYGRDVRVGCIVPEATIADEDVIRRLSGFEVSIREARNEKAMSAIADELIADGYDVLVGGGYLRAFCEMRGIRFSGIGLEESGVSRLIKAAYALLRLKTFLTAGPQEVRAWTFRAGWKAPQCAGVIHTDFEKGFIRAEVIKYDDYIALGSEAAVKEAGKMSVEGKEYEVQDGDIMHFRFNV